MKGKQMVTKKSMLATVLMLVVCMSLPFSSTAARNKSGDAGNAAAAVLRAGEISSTSPAAANVRKTSGFDAFNKLNQNRWQATFSAETGRVKRLYGAQSKAYRGTPEESARKFLQDSHMLFGVQSDLADLETARINQTKNRRHARFQQIHNGVAVQGSQIVVHSDPKGRVTMVQSSLQDSVVPINQNLLSLEDATAIARDDLLAHLGTQAGLGDSKTENKIIRSKEGHVYIWEIATPTQKPPGFWVVHVDAESGEVLYLADESYGITDGKGLAFIKNDDYWVGKYKNVKLYDLFENEDKYREGKLNGLYATIYDYSDDCPEEDADDNATDEKCKKVDGRNEVFEPTLKFIYDPFAFDEVTNEINEYPWNTSKSWFDQTAAYYQHIAAREWWEKNVLKKYGPEDIFYFKWLSVPVVVNVGMWGDNGTSEFCNAFYSPSLYLDPYYDGEPGFAYSDDGTCCSKGFGNEDLVNDNDIVRHEYAHAIMDWVGFTADGQQFGGVVDGYGRAMGEGNSDWYAFLASGQTDIGYVSFPPNGLRSIDNANRYPDDVDYFFAPEEHHTGLIWGGYLYDLSRVLKKKALDFVYPSSFYFDADGGYRDGEADFVDAIRAQRDAEFDRTGKNKNFMKAFGSMVSRGFVRPLADLYPGDERDYIYLSAPLKLKTDANLLVTGDLHEYPVEMQAGMVVTVKVKAKKIGMRAPIIELFSIDGTPLAVTDYSGDTKISKAELEYPITEDGIYVVRVSGRTEPRRGYYKFQMTADYVN